MLLPSRFPTSLQDALSQRGFSALTPVQDAILDEKLAARDLVVSAQTGSGKTVAFGLALAPGLLDGVEKLDRAGDPKVLIIAPTRELALQVQRELAWLYANTGARVISCVGGMDPREERRLLERGAHIVVGTPGRLADHIRRGALVLDDLSAVVLDEADEMLNLGFREELEFILGAAPATRRTLMFSATMPKGIEALARNYLRDAARINTVNAAKQHLDISYRAVVTGNHDVENAIFNVLRFYDATGAIVFCSTREAVNRMMSRFANRGFSVVALSGELSQKERTHALQAMRDGRARVCVATDVAARGIDLPDLDLVIHADPPKSVEGLLHRSGRTGRAGRKGASILMVPMKARRRVERLLQDARIDAQWDHPPSADDVRRKDHERLLNDPSLMEPISQDEKALVAALLERHEVDAIAAAFLRVARKGVAAPEDLEPVSVAERAPRERSRKERIFEQPGEMVWVTLTVGRAQNAEPRWLIPMLCKAGGFTKRDLGQIRIDERETRVEVSTSALAGLMEAAGPDGRLEKGVRLIADQQSNTRSGPVEPVRRHGDSRPAYRPDAEHRPTPRQRWSPEDGEGEFRPVTEQSFSRHALDEKPRREGQGAKAKRWPTQQKPGRRQEEGAMDARSGRGRFGGDASFTAQGRADGLPAMEAQSRGPKNKGPNNGGPKTRGPEHRATERGGPEPKGSSSRSGASRNASHKGPRPTANAAGGPKRKGPPKKRG